MKKSTNQSNQESKNPRILNDYEMNLKVADKIIETIESGNVQRWKKTWTTTIGKTNNELFNLVMDDMLALCIYTLKEANNLFVPAGFYVTFKDIKNHNLKLKKGSKGVPTYKACYINKFLTKEEQEQLDIYLELNPEVKEQAEDVINGKRGYLYVEFEFTDSKGNSKKFGETLYFNKKLEKFYYQKFQFVLEYWFKAQDCGLTLDEIKNILNCTPELIEDPITEKQRIENVERIKDSYIERSKIKFNELEQDKAYYMPSKHSVVVPTKDQFETIEDYYQTTFHEFAHSTGHSSLLNRKTLTAVCGFGTVTYSKEELVAELSSLYTLISLNIATDDILANSIAYLKSWGQGLKEGIKHNILNTINHSRKATNLILGIEEKA